MHVTGTAIAAVCAWAFATPAEEAATRQRQGLDFERLSPVPESLPRLRSFTARDGVELGYRRYPAGSDTAVVLIHGSATHSAYLHEFAESLGAAAVADVYTPDLRGHGPSPQRRGDIDYIDQLEDDLADLIAHIQAGEDDPSRLVVAGHSSGGGLAIRFAGGRHGRTADGYILLAPYLGHDAPTIRPGSGGWAQPNTARIIALSILNGLGISRFNGVEVLRFNLPPDYRTGDETLGYSYRLMTGINPRDYREDLRAVDAPLLTLVGSEDEAFVASAFEPAIAPRVEQATVEIIEGVTHLGLVSDPKAIRSAIEWLRGL